MVQVSRSLQRLDYWFHLPRQVTGKEMQHSWEMDGIDAIFSLHTMRVSNALRLCNYRYSVSFQVHDDIGH